MAIFKVTGRKGNNKREVNLLNVEGDYTKARAIVIYSMLLLEGYNGVRAYLDSKEIARSKI